MIVFDFRDGHNCEVSFQLPSRVCAAIECCNERFGAMSICHCDLIISLIVQSVMKTVC